jgi:peptidoglycan/LPS O-acetylase OafA/YrhL
VVASRAGHGSGSRVAELDILRAVAVFLVLASHAVLPPAGASPLIHVVGSFFNTYGHLGVDLFFVLSGFLVSGLLFREHARNGHIAPGRFLLRRGFKIYPAFYFFLGASVLLRWRAGDAVTTNQILREGLFVQNYGQGVWTHTWSLAVEEHFYLLLAGLFVLLTARQTKEPFRRLSAFCTGLTALVVALRVVTYYVVPYSYQAWWFPTHLRVDSLLFGVLLAYYYHRNPAFIEAVSRAAGRIALAGFALLVVSQSIPIPLLSYAVGPCLVYVGFGAILVAWLSRSSQRRRAIGPVASAVAFVGSFSYSIYLWHTAVFAFGGLLIRKLVGSPGFYAMWLFEVGAAVSFGVLTARLVEMPALRLRDRWFPSRASAL